MKPTQAFQTGLLLLLPGVVAIPAIGVAISQRHPDEPSLDQQLLSLHTPVEPTAAAGLAADALHNGPDQVFSSLPASAPLGDRLLANAGRTDAGSALPSPSTTPPVQTRGVVQFGDTLLKIALRYGITMQEVLRFNPGLDTARLVAGTEIQLVQSAPVRQRAVLGLRPSTSGGLSWPDQLNLDQPKQPHVNRGAQTWIWPTTGVFSSGYGWRWGRMHRGIDIANNTGTPIMAAADGTVTYSRWNDGGFGYLVELRHADGTLTLYAHNSRLLVSEGDYVRQGQVIAQMGSTGRSTGPHLHFEIRPAGNQAVDPLRFVRPPA